MTELQAPELTPEQHTALLDLIKAEPKLGNVAALRKIGLSGHKRDLRGVLTDDLLEEAREARGWNIVAIEASTWTVAADPEHPAWDRANARLLKAYGGPQFRDQIAMEHTGRLEIDSPDVAAAIDRFTALASAAVGAAGRNATDGTPLAIAAVGESAAGVRVGEVVSETEPT